MGFDTDADVAPLTAGTDLDAEIARAVFGWVQAEPITPAKHAPPGWMLIPSETLHPRWREAIRETEAALDAYIIVPRYSTDIAKAWTVAERLRELGLEIIIGNEPDGWEVEITVTEELAAQGYSGCYSKHAPIAEAICSAALTALRDRANHQPA